VPRRSQTYISDSKGNPLYYKGGKRVRFVDFENEPTDTARAEAKEATLKDRVQRMIDVGITVPEDLLKKAGLGNDD